MATKFLLASTVVSTGVISTVNSSSRFVVEPSSWGKLTRRHVLSPSVNHTVPEAVLTIINAEMNTKDAKSLFWKVVLVALSHVTHGSKAARGVLEDSSVL